MNLFDMFVEAMGVVLQALLMFAVLLAAAYVCMAAAYHLALLTL